MKQIAGSRRNYNKVYRALREQDAILHKIWKGERVSSISTRFISLVLEHLRSKDINAYIMAFRSFNDRYAEPTKRR